VKEQLAAAIRAIGRLLFRLFYRIEIEGLEHVRAAGDRALIVVNHTSYLDAPVLVSFLPTLPRFAINTHIAEMWWVRPWLHVVDVFRVDTTSPLSTKAMIQFIRQGRSCVIFPEGRLTQTGSLMKIYEGPGVVADHADAPIVPIRIDGGQFSRFSRLKGKARLSWFPKLRMTVLPAVRLAIPETARGRARRRIAGRQLYDIMSDMMFRTSDRRHTLFQALVDAGRRHGGGSVIVRDVERPLTYRQLIVGALVLGRRLERLARPGEAVGMLLPNAVGAAVTFFALQATGRTAVVLNFSAGAAAVASACRTAEVRLVLTSRRFIDRARLGGLAAALEKTLTLVYLEDIRAEIGLGDRLRGLAAALLAPHRRPAGRPQERAVILFTSGTEGAPKGVVLSHANILANCRQVAARIDFVPSDTVFNALPIFHSFGLTAGMVLPMVSGVPTFLYPSPLHYRIVPEMVYATNATIVFGTDTFLSGYARVAHPYDFYAVRYVFAGAEKLKAETRRTWMEKFGIRILEGYGTTEASPVVSVNTPLHAQAGTVGRLLPGIETRLVEVDGIDTGGVLHIRGPNIMLGYLKAEAPGRLEPPPDGWYDTGDVVSIDEDGYCRILDRVKRFAKVGGEMISLAASEQLAQAVWPEAHHAVVAVPDAAKGEQLVLVTTVAGAGRAAILREAKRAGVIELAVPRRVVPVDALPVLPTGKTDYLAVRRFVIAAAGAPRTADEPAGPG
jgi:acyl-[acyl-carrier-protein]-phospholipid O-acyltransferase/long-chain-fatty-acid--[acyl-carrier-protein] ligase